MVIYQWGRFGIIPLKGIVGDFPIMPKRVADFIETGAVIILHNEEVKMTLSYLDGKSGVSGGVSKSPLFVTLDSRVAERP